MPNVTNDRESGGLAVRIDGKAFVTTGNPHGVSGTETVFRYRVTRERITGTYAGGRVAAGQLLGRVTGPDTIDLLYHALDEDGNLMAGWSKGRVSRNAAGLLELHFEWAWLTGDRSGGESHYVEHPGDDEPSASANHRDGWPEGRHDASSGT